jgi:hypothetical protein
MLSYQCKPDTKLCLMFFWSVDYTSDEAIFLCDKTHKKIFFILRFFTKKHKKIFQKNPVF